MTQITSPLPANCTVDTFLENSCTELPFSLANAEELLTQLEPTPEDPASDWMKLRSFVDGMQISAPSLQRAFRTDGKPGYVEAKRVGTTTDEPYIFSSSVNVANFNPMVETDSFTLGIQQMIFEPLFRADLNNLGRQIPALATELSSTDQKTFILKLREDAKWSDGKAITADDVVYTFQIGLNPEKSAMWQHAFVVDGKIPVVEKIDEHTVRFVFAQTMPNMKVSLTDFMPLPKHVLEHAVQNGQFSEAWYNVATPANQLVTSGPYVVKAYAADEFLKLKRNPYYYGKDDNHNQLPYYSSVHLALGVSNNIRLLEFTMPEKRIAALDAIQPQDVAYLESKKPMHIYRLTGSNIMYYLYFNQYAGADASEKPYVEPKKRELFNDKRFRQAIDLLIPRADISQQVLASTEEVHCLNPSFDPWFSGCKIREHNAAKAAALLKEIGLRKDGQYFTFANGDELKLHLLYPTSSSYRTNSSTILQNEFSNAGLQVVADGIPFDSYQDRVENLHQWDIAFAGNTWDQQPANTQNMWGSGGRLHYWHNHNVEAPSEQEQQIDQYFNVMKTNPDDTARHAAWNGILELMTSENTILPVVHAPLIFAVDAKICNVGINPYSMPATLYNIYEQFPANSRGECAPE